MEIENQPAISDKIEEALSSNEVNFREQNNPHSTPPFKVGVFVVFYATVARIAQNIHGGGEQ